MLKLEKKMEIPITRLEKRVKIFAYWLAALASSVIFAAMPALSHSLDNFEQDLLEREKYVQIIDSPAPDFALQDATGAPVRLSDLRGKVVVLWFVYQRCPDVCPLHSEAVAEVQAMINRTPLGEEVEFVSITTDPEYDLPGSFAAYGAARGLDPANWTMLTSGPEAPNVTGDLARKFGLKFTRQGDGYQLHGVVTHLIDKSGHLRARYHGLKFAAANMRQHIDALGNDDH